MSQTVLTAEAERPFARSPLERVASIADQIAKAGDEAQQQRRLPPWAADLLIDEGLYRFTLPVELGGEDASAWETVEVIEAIAAIDGSVGWNVMIGSEINAMAAGGMDPALAREVYLDNPRVIMCGGGGPQRVGEGRAIAPGLPKAVKVDGGWRIWTQSSFQSGCHNAEWHFGMALVHDTDGQMVLDESGSPNMRLFFIHKSEYSIIDTWDVAGLRGSGSHDVLVDGGFVPDKWADVELVGLPARYANPVFRISVPSRLSFNKVACGLGVARGALDAFRDLAESKIPLFASSTLKHRAVAQFRYAEAEGKLRAARALVKEALEAVCDSMAGGEPAPTVEATTLLRLACTHGTQMCMEVVDTVHNLAGTSAGYMSNPLERKLRDAHAVATHRWVAHPIFEELGKVYLAAEPSPAFLVELGAVAPA